MDRWFSPPSELIPTPQYLLGGQRKARRPPPLSCAEDPLGRATAAVAAKKRVTQEPYLPPDRALSAGGTPLRHGRCAFGKLVLAVPQKIQDFDCHLEDAHGELLLVELCAPDGAWLEDPEVAGVLVAPAAYVPLQAVKRLVQARVNLFGKPVAQLKRLYQLVRPACAPDFALTLVSVADLPTPEPVVAASPPA